MQRNFGTTLTIFSFCGLMLACGTALSDDKRSHRGRSHDDEIQQDDALERLKNHEFKPLSEVLIVAEKVMPGQVVGVKLKRLNGRAAYELKIISNQGRVREVYVDPVNLDILKVE